LIVVPSPFPVAPLVVHRRYLIVVARPMPTVPRRYFIVLQAVARS
jgi:DNA-binding helix-hairpin-helix protein with protein kinase domain